MKPVQIKNMFDGYLNEYDYWISNGDLTKAAEVMELIDEAIRSFKEPLLIVNVH